MAYNRKTRATKKSFSSTSSAKSNGGDVKVSKKTKKALKKNPVIILLIVALILGLTTGVILGFTFTKFEFVTPTLNGVATEETDYVEIEPEKFKQEIQKTKGDDYKVTREELVNYIKLENESVKITFFGKDVSGTVTKEYYYRQDISHDSEKVDGIDYLQEGTYYVIYTSSHFAFKNAKLIRTVIVKGVEIDG